MFFLTQTPTYDEVVKFCEQQIAEGVHLDYKKDLSATRNIAKTICAFGNTQGGTIIVGVEDENNKPKLPANGMPYHDRLSTQIVDIVLGNIFNPIMPDIYVCAPSSSGQTFIIIRVPESNNAPHAIDNDSKIYIRTNDVSNPNSLETLADTKRIEWLWNRRKKSEDLREELKSATEKRFNEIMGRTHNELKNPLLSLIGVPLYPNSTLIEPRQISRDIIRAIEKEGYSRHLPYNMSDLTLFSVPKGVINDYQNQFHYFCELNQFGLYAFIESLERPVPIINNGTTAEEPGGAWLWNILSTIDLYLDSLGEFYKQLNFFGLIKIDISINLKNVKVFGLGSHTLASDIRRNIRTPLEDIHHQRFVEAKSLIQDRKKIIVAIMQTICWDIGFSDINQGSIEGLLGDRHA